MKLSRRNFWIIIAIFALLSAVFVLFIVKNKTPKNNITAAELKEAKKQLNIRFLRYDEDLFSLDLNNLQKEVAELSKKYPAVVIEPDIWKEPRFQAYLKDTVIIALQKAAKKAVKTDVILKELETAFGYYKVFFPNDSIPLIVDALPGLDLSMPSTYIYEDILFVHSDMYLGAENPYYKDVGMPLYIIERCEPIYLPVDIFKKAMIHKHLARPPHTTLLDAMITEGKRLYFTEMMFPALHERYIIGYSEEKYEWANHYLGNAWSHLIEQNELFGKGETLTRTYIEEAPFTKPFGNDSPGRMGTFIGWKLIQSYMENQPEVTLSELMDETNYQKILSSSKFKPQPK
jgi:hypothetical protein